MKQGSHAAKTLSDLYHQLGLPVDSIHASAGFSIHNLKNTGFQLPYQSPSFRPNYFSFLFVKDGAGKYAIDQYEFQVSPHSIYFTNPSNYRTFSWTAINEIYLITFDETFLKEYINKDIFSLFPFLLTETARPQVVDEEFYDEIERLYLQIEKEIDAGSTDRFFIIGHLVAIILYKVKERFFKTYNPIYEGNRSSEIVKTFKKMLDKHYRDLLDEKVDKPWRVQEYADAQHLHPNYLSNVIKSKTGKPIATWIAEKTVSEAKSLLSNTTLTIKEISYKLGFAETAHFSNHFKKHTQSTPVEYRRQSESRQ